MGFKNSNEIEVKNYCNIDCLVSKTINKLLFLECNDEYKCVGILTNSEMTEQLIKKYLELEIEEDVNNHVCFKIGLIDFNPEDYFGEYIISLTNDLKLWVEPAIRNIKGEEKYVYSEFNVAYIYEDCNYKILNSVCAEYTEIFALNCKESIK